MALFGTAEEIPPWPDAFGGMRFSKRVDVV